MADLTLRSVKGSPLTNAEMDGNFEYFTGSHAITGSLTVTEGITGSITNAQTASYAVTASYALNGGGTSNTGDITFEGVKIIGAGTGSGDGNNYSTIELVPDNNLYNNDQYLILDPTAPNHIHVRAGGVIDESNAYLYLGGEKSNVLVSDSNQQVQINTTAANSSSLSWTFTNEGNTIFPVASTPRGDTSGGDLVTNTLKLGDGFNQAVISTPDGVLPNYSSERLVINPGQGSGSGEGGDIYLWAGRGGVDGGSGGDVKVRGGYGPVTGGGGYVRIEGGDTADGNAGFVEIRGGNSNTAAGGTVDIYGGFGNGNTQNGSVSINTYDSTGAWKNWVFDTEGNLTTPGNISVNGLLDAQGITGSLHGTSSWAENVTSASYATTASYALTATPALPYKVYSALITQTGASAPTVTVLQNTLGTINIGYSSPGIYTISSGALFTSNTSVQINSYSRTSANPTINYFARAYRSGPNTIFIETFKFESTPSVQFTATDDALENTFFEIRVY